MGNVLDTIKGRSGRPRSVRTENNTETVRQSLEQSPRKSTRRLSQETDLSRSSVTRIINQDLEVLPYKMQILQLKTDANKAERLAFGQTISQRIEDHPDFLDFIFFSDEANFHLSVHVNKRNMRFWANAQPHETDSSPVDHPWPAHSPDLSPLDYFLWRYLKGGVYANNP